MPPTVALSDEFLESLNRLASGPAEEGPGVPAEVPGRPEVQRHQLRGAPGPQGRPRPDGADRPEVPGRHAPPRRGRRVRPAVGGQPRRGDGLGRAAVVRGQPPHRGLPGLLASRRPGGRCPPRPSRRGGRACWTATATTCCSRSACPRSSCPPSGRSRTRTTSSPWGSTSPTRRRRPWSGWPRATPPRRCGRRCPAGRRGRWTPRTSRRRCGTPTRAAASSRSSRTRS